MLIILCNPVSDLQGAHIPGAVVRTGADGKAAGAARALGESVLRAPLRPIKMHHAAVDALQGL